jgi:hypothetical protein
MVCKCWSTKTNLFQDFDKNISMETYDVNATKPLFLKTLSTKVDLHEASRYDCDLDPKELNIDLIMQKCLDEVQTMTN